MIETHLKKIRAAFIASKWSRNHLAKQSGVAETALRPILSDGWCPGFVTIKRIETALIDGGFLSEEDEAA